MESNTNIPEFRKCVTCKEIKPASHEFFYKDKNRYLGLMYRCKKCDSIRSSKQDRRDRWEKMTVEQKELKQEATRRYGRTLKGKAINALKAYKDRDAEKGRENDLTQEDLINSIGTPCYYCTYPSTGLDRLDNNIGHLKTNCVPACKECNIARNNNFSPEEMLLIGVVIKEIKNNR